MKRRLIAIIALFCFLRVIIAQTSTQLFSINDSTVGTSSVTGLPLATIRYMAGGKISGWHWDGFSDNLLLELKESNDKEASFKNSGILEMVDLKTKEVKWNRPMNYTSSEVRQQGNYYFLSEKKKNFCLHPQTGNVLWENRNEFYFVDPFLNIGIGYPLQSMSNKLTAIDLTTGKELWKKRINRSSGWNDAYMLNDSILLISVDGIKAINLATGNGWSHKANTTRKEIGKMVGINLFGIIMGMFTGLYVYQAQPDVSSDMVSNMLIDPYENTILASKDQISRIDSSGKTVWSTSLPKKKTSKSSLFLIDSTVYMINRGYAQYNGNFSMIGDPYLASFDLESGKQLYLTSIPEKKEFIRNFQVVNNKIFVVFEEKIVSYSLNDGVRTAEKVLELEEGEYLDSFVESGIYCKGNDPFFKELASEFYNYNLMMTSKDRIFVLTDNLETVLIYGKNDLYYKKASNPQYTLISKNDSDFIVLDNSDKSVATLKASPDMFLHHDKLYFLNKDSFSEVDLDQLHQSPSLWQSIFKDIIKFMPK